MKLSKLFLEASETKKLGVEITCDIGTDGKRQPKKDWEIEYKDYYGKLIFNRKGSEVDEFEIEWDDDIPENNDELEDAVNHISGIISRMKHNQKITI